MLNQAFGEQNGPNPNEPIPAQTPEGSARIPFTGPSLSEAEGYRAAGPNTPQEGSGQGAADSWVTGDTSQAGADAPGYTHDLPGLIENSIGASDSQMERFETMYAAGRAQQGLVGTDMLNTAAEELLGHFEGTLDSNKRDILFEMFLAGIEGTGNEQGDGVVNTDGWDSGNGGE